MKKIELGFSKPKSSETILKNGMHNQIQAQPQLWPLFYHHIRNWIYFCTLVWKYKNQIEELFKIQVRVRPIDFNGFDLLDVADLELILSDLEVEMFLKLGYWLKLWFF